MATWKKPDQSREKNAALVALGQQIRTVREGRGISQEDFAAQAGIARSYYGGIERGERNVAALNLMLIAAALGVEVGELFPPVRILSELQNGTKGVVAEEE
ncbi:MAG TPA: helix-turn-helix transcriptional regulator [Abditibacterium sp.]|jgi:transcriptional regulator with XRE-family HTH domain